MREERYVFCSKKTLAAKEAIIANMCLGPSRFRRSSLAITAGLARGGTGARGHSTVLTAFFVTLALRFMPKGLPPKETHIALTH